MNLPVQPYDFLMLAVLVLSALFGAWKGMAWQIAAVASLIVSTLVALRFGGAVAPLIRVQEPWNYCVAMLILYVAASLVIWVLFRMVADFIDRVRLREFDRQVGAMFGLAKGVLWCMVITFFAVTLSDVMRARVLGSRSGYYAALLVHRATPLLPTKVRDVLGHYIEEFDRNLPSSQLAEPQPAPGDERPAVGPETAGPRGADLPPYRTARGGAGGWDLSPDAAEPADPAALPAESDRQPEW